MGGPRCGKGGSRYVKGGPRCVRALPHLHRYNPENLATLERYVETQAKENAYDLEANLAVLKLYQFNPAFFQTGVTAQILLKALTNLPHTDFTLCKCMIDQAHQEERPIRQILYLGELLETCHFQSFWVSVPPHPKSGGRGPQNPGTKKGGALNVGVTSLEPPQQALDEN
uniref:Eukaryotic translation initiation factor 3 subunit K n=1 Tax=Cyanoderma ruficeps TaxID=181631 RepID=A0A8C3QZA3_9PASS